jgi:hypothetical protein
MKSLHTKSPCCRGKIYRFGNRRRQCAVCGKTWRIRRKRKGRKSYRINKQLLRRVLLEGRSLKQEFRKEYSSLSNLYYRFRQSLEWFTRQPRNYQFNSEQLILLADGLWFQFNKEKWVLFLMALKPTDDNKAILFDPILLEGGESYDNWQAVLSTIPEEAKKRIVVFVSDDFRASDRLVKERSLIHQLCHFHLIAQLQIRRGRRKSTVEGRNIREDIYQSIRQALITTDKKELEQLQLTLQKLIRHPVCPRKLKMMVNQFLRSINHYRAYLIYPELNLPNTTNAIESTGNLIRNVASTLNTPKALYLWSKALIRLRSEITCNGKDFQPN